MAHERTRYYQETREGIYNGPLFLVAQLLQSIPLSLFTTLIGALIIFRGLKNELLCTENPSSGERSCMPYSDVTQNKLGNFLHDFLRFITENWFEIFATFSDTIERENINYWMEYGYYPDFIIYWLTIWACYLLAEQQTSSFLIVVKSSYTAALSSIYITIVYLVLGSGTVR